MSGAVVGDSILSGVSDGAGVCVALGVSVGFGVSVEEGLEVGVGTGVGCNEPRLGDSQKLSLVKPGVISTGTQDAVVESYTSVQAWAWLSATFK